MPYPTATPESQGLDSSRLAKLTAWQEQMVADGKVRSKTPLAAYVCRVMFSSELKAATVLVLLRAAAASCRVPRSSWHAVGRSSTGSAQARPNLAYRCPKTHSTAFTRASCCARLLDVCRCDQCD